MASRRNTIDEFIERVLTLQAEQKKSLTPDELRRLAFRIGATEEDLEAAAEEADKRHDRGLGYARHGRWSDAIAELREASALAPHTLEIMHALATAHAQRGRSGGGEADYDTATDLCRRCIELDPNDDASFELLNELERALARRRRMWWLLCVAIAILAIVGAWILWPTPAAPAGPSAPAPPPPLPKPAVPVETGPPAVTPKQVPRRSSVDVHFAARDASLGFEPRDSRLGNHADGSDYELRAIVINQGKQEIHGLKLKVELLDEHGAVVGKPSFSRGVSHSQPPMRPGDVTGLSVIERTTPAVTAARVSVHFIRKQPAPPQYDADKPVAVRVDPSVDPIELSAFERYSEVKELGSAHTHRTHLEVRNGSDHTLAQLELEVRYLDKSGQVLAKGRCYVVPAGAPALRPGKSRVVGLVDSVEGPVHGYQLWVKSWR